AAHEFVALTGPSGSGKSTLLNVIGLLEAPGAGRLCIDGADTTQMSEAQRTALRGRTIGFVFQYHHLLPAFTALENVLLPVLAARGSVEAADEARARALLQRVGLGAAMGKRPGELSGGMQQRVAIARALVLQPRLPDRHARPAAGGALRSHRRTGGRPHRRRPPHGGTGGVPDWGDFRGHGAVSIHTRLLGRMSRDDLDLADYKALQDAFRAMLDQDG
ncbi:MAG: ATP-binding cassette domain-containing protein, partial [Anaerolineales bacterium]|nr:ATP-binding cassette domain-containing protein [Anaerolineales bacterium]